MKHSSCRKQILPTLFTIFLFVLSAVALCTLYAAEAREKSLPAARTHIEADALPSGLEGGVSDAAASPTRRHGVQNFLLCGKDRASGLCDVIIIARLDAEARSASLVQIPRDTYAAYTENSYRKLNGAPSALGGIDGLRDFLAESLGVPIDHYALVDLDCVGDVVDAIGGVPITIPEDMDYEDGSQGLSIHLKAGTQTLNGDTAEQFLRYRSGYATADLGRLDAQKLFLSSLLSAVKAHNTLPDLVRIVRTLYGRVETDLSLGDCIRLASVGLRLSPEGLSMETLPGKSARTEETSGAWYYILCRDAAFDTVNRLLNVTDTPLSSTDFDPKERFTSTAHPHFDAIYRSTHITGKTVSDTSAGDRYAALPRLTG